MRWMYSCQSLILKKEHIIFAYYINAIEEVSAPEEEEEQAIEGGSKGGKEGKDA